MFEAVRPEVIERARGVRLVAFDVDGVLTDGGLLYSDQGEVLKRFHVRDGLGMRLLREQGYTLAVISARGGAVLRRRLQDLGIVHLCEKTEDKRQALVDLAQRLNIELANAAFVGDDLVDLPALAAVGLAVSVADAHPRARQAVHYVTQAAGGFGAVRELCDLLLHASGRLQTAAPALQARQAAGFSVIIPARYGSTRLPGKPLRVIGDKPMVVHVCDNAKLSGATTVLVATDDVRIQRAVEAAGYQAVLTSSEHRSGTDRLAEVVESYDSLQHDILVNVQGDEPLLGPEFIESVGAALSERPSAGMATLAAPIQTMNEWQNPNIVKVITDQAGMARYFSRAAIPFVRDQAQHAGERLPDEVKPLRHIGIYAYRAETLRQIASAPPTMAERCESLEQLRALWLGIDIVVKVVDEPPAHGVDTEADLLEAVERLKKPAPTLEPRVTRYGV